jgi:hypothetical protein
MLGCAKKGQDPSDFESALDAAPVLSVASELTIPNVGTPAADSIGLVTDVGMDYSGNLYLLDGYGMQVVVFDSTGRELRKFGRKGEGPGEFGSPRLITVIGDSVFIVSDRLSIFDRTGKFLAVSPATVSVFGRAEGIWQTNRGLATLVVEHGSLQTASRIDVATMDTYDARTAILHPTGVRIPQTFYNYGLGMMGPKMLGHTPELVVGCNSVYSSNGDTFEIERQNLDGTSLSRIGGVVRRVRTSVKDMTSSIRWWTDMMRSWAPADTLEFPRRIRVLKRAPRSRYRPQIGRMVVNCDGILVERPDVSEDPYSSNDPTAKATWAWLDPTGRPLGQVVLPTSFTPRMLVGCLVIGLSEPSSGEHLVKRYRLTSRMCAGR